MGARKTWTRRWTVQLEDGPAGAGRTELDQLMVDLSAILVQTGGSVVMSAHRVQVGADEYETSHVFIEFDAYSPGLNFDEVETNGQPDDDLEGADDDPADDDDLGVHEPEPIETNG